MMREYYITTHSLPDVKLIHRVMANSPEQAVNMLVCRVMTTKEFFGVEESIREYGFEHTERTGA